MKQKSQNYGSCFKELRQLADFKYKDLEANRDDRVYEFCHYIYVDNDGIYPKNIKVNVCIDTKEVFTWL